MFICAKTKNTLYNKWFYLGSCIANALCNLFAYSLVSDSVLMLIFFSILVAFAFENVFRNLTESELNDRYILKVLFGIITITISMWSINKDYVLFFPLMFGSLYLNFNVYLRSKVLEYTTKAFLFTPFIKLFFMNNIKIIEYAPIMVCFAVITIVSNMLFIMNSKEIKEVENRSDVVKEIFRLMNHLSIHDIRNELQKMQILCTKKYRGDVDLFMDTFKKYSDSIMALIDKDIFTNFEEVNLKDLIENMNHITGRNVVDFSYIEKDDSEVNANKNVLYSTIKNFIENSIEAAMKTNDRKYVTVIKEKKLIRIIDNCGGFDINNIYKGRTTKIDEKYHGVFLKTIIDPAIKNLFGFLVEIVRLPEGTEIQLRFV